MHKHLLPLAALALTLGACDGLSKPEAQAKNEPQEATQDTAVVYPEGQKPGDAVAVAEAWNVDANLPDVRYEEITTKDVTVRGNERYSVYSVDEAVFFDTDKSALKPTATATLEQITGSIGKRFADKQVRIMGFTDARGAASYNKELSAQRAEAVKSWLVQNGKIDAGRVSLEPMGEQAPTATNATAAGRQQNRRVEIVVRNG